MSIVLGCVGKKNKLKLATNGGGFALVLMPPMCCYALVLRGLD